jgi:hypothetical protein
VWGAGLVWLRTAQARPYRILGWMYLVPLLILIINGHSKPEYLAPAYSMFFAAGGLMLEVWLAKRFLRWVRPLLLALLASGALLLPLAIPILPVESYIRYAAALRVAPSTAEGLRLAKLPQHFADCFGWEEMTRTVAAVYRSLPDSEMQHCVIYGQNYGEAGAISFLGRPYGLPPAYSGHNNFWFWGPPQGQPSVVIVVGGDPDDHRRVFRQVTLAGRVNSEYAIPYENDLPVYVCRGLQMPLSELWPRARHFE